MRAVIIATAAAVVIGFLLFASKPSVDVSSATLALFAATPSVDVSSAKLAPISVWDAHNHAQVEGLPVLHFEDLSFAFTESGDKPAPAARLVVRDTGQR